MTPEVEKSIRRLVFSFARKGFEVDDLLQEARLAAWQAENSWRPESGSSLKTYVYERVKWTLIRDVRNAKRLKRFLHWSLCDSMDADARRQPGRTLHEVLPSREESALTQCLQKEVLQYVCRRLGSRDADVVLSLLAGQTCRETALQCALSKSRVDQICQRAKELASAA